MATVEIVLKPYRASDISEMPLPDSVISTVNQNSDAVSVGDITEFILTTYMSNYGLVVISTLLLYDMS